jgi:hypothetical protein
MNANDIKQILTLSASGMTAEEISAMFSEQEREARCDDAQAFEDDDSDSAYERRCEARGMGKYDFNDYAQNDAGEYIHFM